MCFDVLFIILLSGTIIIAHLETLETIIPIIMTDTVILALLYPYRKKGMYKIGMSDIFQPASLSEKNID